MEIMNAPELAALGLLLLSGDTALRARLQHALDLLREEHGFPGAELGVARADGSSFALATGLSDREKKLAMTTDLLLLQGSIGKTYVAATALQLVKEGKIDLDAKIATLLAGEPWLPRLPNGRDITVRMLMSHTSGLVRYELKEAFTKDLSAHPEKTWRPAELIAYMLDSPAPFPAGTGWEYSDTNYIVLGMVIERLTGAKLDDEIERRLLRPLGLEHTVPSDRRRIPGLSQGYAGEKNPFGGVDAMLRDGEMVINPQFEWAGGGYASTAEDLAKWMRAFHAEKLVDPALLEEARKGVPAPMLGKDVRYGLGVIILDTPLGPAYGHSGFFPGYCAEAYWFQELGAAIALQINSSDLAKMKGSPRGMLVRLAEAFRKSD
jgi:D-alanyl-D-alanine carboxypeptidase